MSSVEKVLPKVIPFIRVLRGPLAQLVEQYTFNVRVDGSSPSRLTINMVGFYFFPGPVRLAWPRTPPFHGGDRGSNPLRDAILFRFLFQIIAIDGDCLAMN